MLFRTTGKKIPDNLLQLVLDENEPDLPYEHNNATVLGRFHDKHELADGRANTLFGIYLDGHLILDISCLSHH
jgi:hypothetical protein